VPTQGEIGRLESKTRRNLRHKLGRNNGKKESGNRGSDLKEDQPALKNERCRHRKTERGGKGMEKKGGKASAPKREPEVRGVR